MATLYEINEQIAGLVDPETGEIADFEAFEKLNLDLDTKIKNIALWIVNLRSDAEQLEEQEKKFRDRKTAAKNKAESLKNLLDGFLSGEKRSYPEVVISYRKSEQVAVDDDAKLDDRFLRIKTEIDKTALKDALKHGESIEGARLEVKNNIQIK
nr:MAG TPA: resistance protein [Caudoviricetes sp.]